MLKYYYNSKNVHMDLPLILNVNCLAIKQFEYILNITYLKQLYNNKRQTDFKDKANHGTPNKGDFNRSKSIIFIIMRL